MGKEKINESIKVKGSKSTLLNFSIHTKSGKTPVNNTTGRPNTANKTITNPRKKKG